VAEETPAIGTVITFNPLGSSNLVYLDIMGCILLFLEANFQSQNLKE